MSDYIVQACSPIIKYKVVETEVWLKYFVIYRMCLNTEAIFDPWKARVLQSYLDKGCSQCLCCGQVHPLQLQTNTQTCFHLISQKEGCHHLKSVLMVRGKEIFTHQVTKHITHAYAFIVIVGTQVDGDLRGLLVPHKSQSLKKKKIKHAVSRHKYHFKFSIGLN